MAIAAGSFESMPSMPMGQTSLEIVASLNPDPRNRWANRSLFVSEPISPQSRSEPRRAPRARQADRVHGCVSLQPQMNRSAHRQSRRQHLGCTIATRLRAPLAETNPPVRRSWFVVTVLTCCQSLTIAIPSSILSPAAGWRDVVFNTCVVKPPI